MAFSPQERYVDPSLAANTGRGTRATITLSAATFTFSTLNLNETNAFSSYTFVTGDEIFLTGGTAVTTGFHTIASRTDASNIVMAADITTDSSDPTDVTSDTAPYGDLQFGLDTADHPASGGGRINIKIGAGDGGTDEILAAALNLNTSGTGYLQTNATANGNYLIFQGYTTQSDDGGIGGVSGNGSVSILSSSAQDRIVFRDLHLHNVGNNEILFLDKQIVLINCELDTSTKTGNNLDFGTALTVVGCYFHTLNGVALNFQTGIVYRNRFIDLDATNSFERAMRCDGNFGAIIENIVWLKSTGAIGIEGDFNVAIIGNSVFHNASGTGEGIKSRGSTTFPSLVINNLVEGFSGASGAGISAPSGTHTAASFGNAVEDCTVDYENTTDIMVRFDEEELGASPFTDGAAKDFSPVDTGNVKEKSQPKKIGLFTV